MEKQESKNEGGIAMYKLIGEKELVDAAGNIHMCEIRDYGMTKEQMEDWMQEVSFINQQGVEEIIDLRYL